MVEGRIDFADANAYERFMGRWSRAVAPQFLRWIEPPLRAGWLDVGCGTGVLTEALLDSVRTGLCDRDRSVLRTEVPAIAGTAHSSLQALSSLFSRAGLQAIRSRTVDVTLAYVDFEDFWLAQTAGYGPPTEAIGAMS